MNIADTLTTPVYTPVVTERVENKTRVSSAGDTRSQANTQEERTGMQALTLDKGDRFTASEMPVGNALYDVTRVKQGNQLSGVSGTITRETLHGEKITRKMADIPLATGINLLHIYQTDNQS